MLRKRLLISYLSLVLAILLVIGFAVYGTISDAINAQMTAVAQTAFQSAVRTVEKRFNQLNSVALEISVDDLLQTHLDAYASAPSREHSDALRSDTLRLGRLLDGDQLQLFPVGSDGTLYGWDDTCGRYEMLSAPAEEAWYTIYRQGTKHVEIFSHGGGFIAVKNIVALSDWQSTAAVLVIRIRDDSMSSVISGSDLGSTGTLSLTTRETVLTPVYRSGDDAASLFDAARSMPYIEKDKMVFYQYLRSADLYLAGTISVDEIMQKSAQMRQTFLIAAAVAILVSVLLSVALSRSISNPIIRIADGMKDLMGGDLDARLDAGGQKGEILLLCDSYNYMTQVIKDLLEDVYTAQQNEKQAELQALQAQINPHFLYNTLDSINWMSFKYGAEDIQNMVHSLATMLRHSLNNGENMIAVRNELEQLNSYLYIQQIRYDNSFVSTFLIDPNILEHTIIKLILQPLVENAIIHGFVDLESGGKLFINGYLEQGDIVFDVMNNGRLIDLALIRRRLDSPSPTKGYGINNVNARLINQYGANHSLSYSIHETYTVARVRIPAEGGASK